MKPLINPYKLVMVVSGGRDCVERNRTQREFWNYLRLCAKARNIKKKSEVFVIVGCARGVDKHIRDFCKSKNIPHKKIKAEWSKYKRRAGIIRNKKMINYVYKPTNAFFMYDGESPGTSNMIEEVSKIGIPNCTVYYKPTEEL